jgi:ribosome-binding factor A
MARKPASPGLPSQRQLRAGEIIRHALAEIIAREDLRDPELGNVLVTVGEVRCSPDLKRAKVYVTPLGDDSEAGRARLANALNRAAAKASYPCQTSRSSSQSALRRPAARSAGSALTPGAQRAAAKSTQAR